MDKIEQGLFERLINAVKNKCTRTARARIRQIITKHELAQKYLV